MRNLIVLFACSLVMSVAGANEPPAAKQAVAAKPAAAASASASATAAAKEPSIKPVLGKPAVAEKSAKADRAKEDEAELDLSERIAVRLAEMRATQAARAANAAKAQKIAEAKKREAAIIAATPPPPPPPARGTHWTYDGESGPGNWSKINVDWGKCSTGTRQSPIDLRDGIKVDLEQITFDYHQSSFREVDNGHTIMVTVGGGNFITVNNQTYELQQFHFHRPSEEKIAGKGTEMVMHLVHKSAEGKLAVVAVLLERGKAHPLMQTVWNNLPLEKLESVSPTVVLDLMEALPARRDYFTFMGSLSEPPCTEGVLYIVMKQTMQASPAQMALFSRLYPFNARPVQPTNGRVVKESN
ncbi:carbonic anhydrase [Massilia sp. S19_KUP03_FR1]|uniref:carbonic anhydrase n=1 Tax=Massilia sp. S19_KUP03_FR1 TaxID=3025503 RepID=UPI002FCD6EFE